MTNTIKASEVKPGMTIRWNQGDMRIELPVKSVKRVGGAVVFQSSREGLAGVPHDVPVTVLSEPAPGQPEEPRWIAARAKVGDRRFFRVDESDRPWRKANCMGHIFPYQYSWSDVCNLGLVTVIPDQGWEVPAEAPEVPDRIEEWPEDDEHLRAYQWRDRDGDLWWSVNSSRNPWIVRFADRTGAFHPYPECGPWVRVP